MLQCNIQYLSSKKSPGMKIEDRFAVYCTSSQEDSSCHLCQEASDDDDTSSKLPPNNQHSITTTNK